MRYRLRTLLIVTTAAAVGLGWFRGDIFTVMPLWVSPALFGLASFCAVSGCISAAFGYRCAAEFVLIGLALLLIALLMPPAIP